ncbi:DUF2271 domain-containing protein [Neptunicella marina]|uniref:DUF2271 domain-containing protein n=1 Tax=Neptunicella marina TaxID=2125989 RepID=A0A8J6ISG9_9ALTE|nr:DUF2271 domain-containing protein [Neptunicella marina]MBC3764771.1 DUF2271 domain-containing protein [Neptunicella marina]
MKKLLPLLALSLPLSATTFEANVELPQLDVAEYHAPYLAMWVQSSDRKTIKNLALWYDHDKAKGKGQEWLKDLRQWWRRSGRGLDMPAAADAFTGATKTSGSYQLSFDSAKLGLTDLPAGEYKFYIEAVREVGGREVLSVPFTLPADKALTLTLQGKSELGQVSLTVKP